MAPNAGVGAAAKTGAANNPAQPFSNARDGYGVIALLFEVSRRW